VQACGFAKINNGEKNLNPVGRKGYSSWKINENPSHLNAVCGVVNIQIA
jgi:hypothetical protein